MDVRVTSTLVALAFVTASCGGRTVVVDAPAIPLHPEKVAELWNDPAGQPRDLFWGIGGKNTRRRRMRSTS